ncbi:MAG: hypothetical protein C4297_06060 [Gemmataceae bacterium]
MSQSQESRKIARLVRVPTAQEAHLLCQLLADAGIEARVVGDYLDAGFGSLHTIPAEVWVYEDDLERAREVLQRQRHDSGADATDERTLPD